MADIQHVDIPDGERHELKGASTALVGQIPVSDGVGGTAFKKLTAANLEGVTGDGPLSVVGGVIGVAKTAYATIRKTSSNSAVIDGNNQGITVQSGAMKVQRAGIYHISSTNGFSVTTTTTNRYPPESGPQLALSISTVNYPLFRNRSTGATLFVGLSGIVSMNTTDLYEYTTNSSWTVVQIG